MHLCSDRRDFSWGRDGARAPVGRARRAARAAPEQLAPRVRFVDTRHGASRVVAGLERVPERVAPGGYPTDQHPLVLYDPRSQPYATVQVAHLDGGGLRLGQSIPVSGLVGHYYKGAGVTHTAGLGAVTTRAELGLVFERDDQYVVLWPGRWHSPETFGKPFGAHTTAVMHTSERLYCLDRLQGHVRVLGKPGPTDPVAQPILNIKQLLRAQPYNDILAVGESAAGRPAVGLLGARGWHAYELPAGAIVHDVYWPGDIYRFRVTYTLPGEPVEPESMKEQEFLPLDQRAVDPSWLEQTLTGRPEQRSPGF